MNTNFQQRRYPLSSGKSTKRSCQGGHKATALLPQKSHGQWNKEWTSSSRQQLQRSPVLGHVVNTQARKQDVTRLTRNNSIDDFHSCPVCCFFSHLIFTSYHPYVHFYLTENLETCWTGHTSLTGSQAVGSRNLSGWGDSSGITTGRNQTHSHYPSPKNHRRPNKNSGITPFTTHCMQLMANKGFPGLSRGPLGCRSWIPRVDWSNKNDWYAPRAVGSHDFAWSYSVASQIPFGRSSSESQPIT